MYVFVYEERVTERARKDEESAREPPTTAGANCLRVAARSLDVGRSRLADVYGALPEMSGFSRFLFILSAMCARSHPPPPTGRREPEVLSVCRTSLRESSISFLLVRHSRAHAENPRTNCSPADFCEATRNSFPRASGEHVVFIYRRIDVHRSMMTALIVIDDVSCTVGAATEPRRRNKLTRAYDRSGSWRKRRALFFFFFSVAELIICALCLSLSPAAVTRGIRLCARAE